MEMIKTTGIFIYLGEFSLEINSLTTL